MDVRRLADSAPAFLLKVCLEWQLMGWELRGKLFYKEVMREHCLCVCVCVRVCLGAHKANFFEKAATTTQVLYSVVSNLFKSLYAARFNIYKA